MSSPSGVEGLAFYKDFSIKVRPASPSVHCDEFLQGPQISQVPDRVLFLRK